MALIKCPECKKEVSNTANKCPNCNFILNKPKRGITGVVFKTLFILFNAIMIIWIISLWSISSGDAELGAAKTIGTGMLIFIWMFFGLPLGIMNYITRPKAYG